MKKLLCTLLGIIIFSMSAFAKSSTVDTETILNDMQIQNRISNIGFRILNSNQIDLRMIFVYNKKTPILKPESELTKRQIIIYGDSLQFISDDAEAAALLAQLICRTVESYSGAVKGLVGSAQVKFAPKKYEIFFDKRAVDYLVKAGYNPLALITLINKSEPQSRIDRLAHHNLTSKRLAQIYEYIYFQYPSFLADNEYLTNEYYQNFLLTSIENRKKLYEKVKTGSKEKIKYE